MSYVQRIQFLAIATAPFTSSARFSSSESLSVSRYVALAGRSNGDEESGRTTQSGRPGSKPGLRALPVNVKICSEAP
jgi:hypothetical protein